MSEGDRHLVIGTCGHIDHGKSALVRALTGDDPDRLPEEKRRGITIELGFARWDLGEGLAVEQAELFEFAEAIGQDLGGQAGQGALDLARAGGSLGQLVEHRERPLAVDHIGDAVERLGSVWWWRGCVHG